MDICLGVLGGRHMECAYYFDICLGVWVDGTWNVPSTLIFFGSGFLYARESL